jgi:signal transduction histidine kinase
LKQFDRFLEQSTDPQQKALVLSRIAWIYEMQLDTERAWQSLENAFGFVGKQMPGDSPWRALLAALRWPFRKLLPRRAVRDAAEAARLELLCSLYYQTARLASSDGKPMRILQAALIAVDPAERLGPSTSLVKIYLTLSFVFVALGRKKTGRKYLARAGDVARATGDPVAVALSLQIHGAVASWEGDLRDALEMGRKCLEEYGHWRELSEFCLLAYNQQFIEALRGRALEAWRWMERVVDKVDQHEGNAILLELLELGARAALTSVGREHEAESKLARLREMTVPAPAGSGFYAMAHAARLRLVTERGDLGSRFDELVAEFQAAKFDPRRVHILVAEYYIHVAHARVHAILRGRETERPARIAQLGAALSDLQKTARIPLIRAHAVVVEAYYAMFLGQRARSERLFEQAEQLGQRECAPWVLYAVHRGRAHFFRSEGLEEAARDQARLAEALAEEHGMAYRLRWIREEFGLRHRPAEVLGRSKSLSRGDSSSWQPRGARPEGGSGQLMSLLRLPHVSGDDLEPRRQAGELLDEIVHGVRGDQGHLFLSAAGSHDLPLQPYASRAAAGKKSNQPGDACRQLVERAFRSWRAEFGGGAAVSSYLITTTTRVAVVAAPFAIAGATAGLVYVERDIARGPFSEADGELLAALATQVPIALELARALNSRRRIEEELQKAQKLEAMGRMARAVARDFSRALADIRSATGALLSASSNGAGEKVRAIEDAAVRAERLTERLTTFADARTQDAELVDVNDRIQRSTTLLKEVLGPKIELEVRAGAGVDPVAADVRQIDHMLVALAMRARDVMPHGGRLVIETSNASVDDPDVAAHPAAKPGRYVQVAVADIGRAARPSAEVRSFEPFSSDDDAGHELALGTLYSNVVQNGGFIDVESAGGKGTTFRVYWSRAHLDESAKSAIVPQLPRGSETILLVEHETFTGDVLGRVLKGLGYRVLRASDGVEALRLAARRYLDIDMVISDAILPGMSGLELGRELLKMRKALRLLYLSDTEGFGGNGGGEVEVLPKPVRQDVLAKRVREVLDRRIAT